MIIIQNKSFLKEISKSETVKQIEDTCKRNTMIFGNFSKEVYEKCGVLFKNFVFPYIDAANLLKAEKGIYSYFICIEQLPDLYENLESIIKENKYNLKIDTNISIEKLIEKETKKLIKIKRESRNEIIIPLVNPYSNFITPNLADFEIRNQAKDWLSFCETVDRAVLRLQGESLYSGSVLILKINKNSEQEVTQAVARIIKEKLHT